jgi:hypothetical protein
MQAPDFSAMTKAAIAAFARDTLGLTLSPRLTRAAMIALVRDRLPAPRPGLMITDMRQQPVRLAINGHWHEIAVRQPVPHSPQLMAALEAANIIYEWV